MNTSVLECFDVYISDIFDGVKTALPIHGLGNN